MRSIKKLYEDSINKINKKIIELQIKYGNIKVKDFIDKINKKIENNEELTKDEKNIIELLKHRKIINWEDKKNDAI